MRAARFTLNPFDNDEWVGCSKNYDFLDELMAEIPGKDNYGAVLYDDAFDAVSYPYNSTDSSKRLNAAYYHRWMRVESKDATGRKKQHRRYADENFFMATMTHPKVAGVELNECNDRNHSMCRRHR
ncbi:hypothetical protein LSAT2_001348 [Lamellibrachia satsuma]|nr:hypothetical protein LSAT2_001348 [Lamellibrachia satsuma]